MSGLHPHAELVHVPTFAPPVTYQLDVFETNPELLNLVIGSAEAQFLATGHGNVEVVIQDQAGAHHVPIKTP